MSKKIFIQIAKPCHQNWNEMAANEQGAFCKSCKKNVTDFTNKTENEIYNIVTTAQGELCGRFTNFQLEQPVRKTELKNGWLKWRAIAASIMAFFSFNKITTASDLDTIPKKFLTVKTAPEVVITATRAPVIRNEVLGNMQVMKPGIRGKVIEQDSKEPLAFAGIRLKKSGLGTVSDEDGNFYLSLDPALFKDDTLVVYYVGYKTQEFEVSHFNTDKPIEMKVELHYVTMGLMVVTQKPLKMDEGINLLDAPRTNTRNQHNERVKWKRE